jgi:RNA polymerase sigma factor (sigma-70 family)
MAANEQLTGLVRRLGRAALLQAEGGLPDSVLLERYIDLKDNAAFETLVRRHGPMVWAVSRRVLQNSADAEDAFQATFLVLVRKAATIRPRAMVGNWLYGVAQKTALKAMAMSGKRRVKEMRAGRQRFTSTSQDPTEDLQPILDRELSGLPNKYRAAIVLCDLEGKPIKEVARHLGWPQGTLATRLRRGRALLAKRLRSHGLTLSASTLTALLCRSTVSATVPPRLISITLAAASRFVLWQGGLDAISLKVAALVKGVLKGMLLEQLKAMGLTLITVGLVGAAMAVAMSPLSDPGTDKPARLSEQNQQPQAAAMAAPEVITKSFKTGATPDVVIEMLNGPIVITTMPEDAVTVSVTKSANDLIEAEAKELLANLNVCMSQDGNQVKVVAAPKEKKMGKYGFVSASAEVHAPAGARLEVRSCNGSVTLTGGSGPARIDTSNGSIRVRDRRGDLHLSTRNGPITVVGANGKLDLRTSNAGIDIRADQAAVTAQTWNGSVRFSGSLADGTHKFRSMNGNIECILPANARFRIEAGTTKGRITSTFPLKSVGRAREDRLSAVVGDNPSVVISAHTSDGGIRISAVR